MKIIVTDRVSKWFHSEMGLSDGRGVRFFGKVYGSTPVHEGFSLAMMPDDHPENPYAMTKKDGVNYYVPEDDRWFFKGYDLIIDYDASHDSPRYNYVENGEM
ncbi:HesB/YadR/YfhF family protein [Secundilactobacillus hailunensis]|uniref:HesB/YadR/YfhF family protein n=1 Tax=Secundilactobacillus hailunensis TaxID=2559923 RepID=A0ABW1TC89_9LACO|nr:iron-sulfur cluster biosynthesis protein [Secundilactobacillus hailunensis]